MGVVKRLAEVQTARVEIAAMRREVQLSAASLMARVYARPLTTLGMTAGAGLLLGQWEIPLAKLSAWGGVFHKDLAKLLTQMMNIAGDLGVQNPHKKDA